jgi:cobalt-zinc-cadmium efflux system protein
MSDEKLEIRTADQRNILWIVLALNVVLAVAFLMTGLSAGFERVDRQWAR